MSDQPNPYQSPFAETATPQPPQATGAGEITVLLLAKTRPWVLALAILGFLVTALIVLMAIGLGWMIYRDSFAGLVVVGTYGLMAAVYFAGSLLLLRYARRISDFVARPTIENLDLALEAQMKFWRLIGICVLGVIGLYVIFFVSGAFIAGLTLT